MFAKVLGFAPDAPPETSGALIDCNGFVPSIKGIRAIPSGVDSGLGTLTATCVGMFTTSNLSGSKLTFAGTATQLKKATTSWSDVSRVSATAYAVAVGAYWTFAQYGNLTFAANKADIVQASSGSNFADNSSTMKAKIAEVVGDQLFLFDVNSTGYVGADYGDQTDRWWASALGDTTNFVPDIATQCVTNRLTRTPGPIEAGKVFGNGVVAYKEMSMYVANYIGPPYVWQWDLLTDVIGASGVHNVIKIGDPVTRHLFIGYDDIYQFNGQTPSTIGKNVVTEWFFDNLSPDYRSRIIGVNDKQNWRAFWFFPDRSSTGELNKWLCYNYRTDSWGKGSLTVQFVLEYVPGGLVYNDLGSLYTTYDSIPAVAYDSGTFSSSGLPMLGYFDSTKNFNLLTGVPGTSTLDTNDVGTDGKMTLITRVRPRFVTSPTSATQTWYYRDNLGDSKITGLSSTLTSGSFDGVSEARWQSARQSYVGDVEITGFDIEAEERSLE